MITIPSQPDSLLAWMGNLADTTRLRLLRLLERQKLGVNDLCEVLQMPQSTVSRHLKVLADDRWVSHHRQGTTNLYRMVLDELNPTQRQLWLLVCDQTDDWASLAQDELRLGQILQRRDRDVGSFFNDAASDWDAIRTEYYGATFSTEAIMALLPPQWTVADLGCGTGSITAELARFVKRVIGVDNSKAMLNAANQRIAQLKNVELRLGDLESLPITDGECDAAMVVLVLTYVEQITRVLTEMHRIIKPGGRAVVVDLMRHDRDEFRRHMGQNSMGFEVDELLDLVRQSGFSTVDCVAMPPQQQAKGPALLLASAIK